MNKNPLPDLTPRNNKKTIEFDDEAGVQNK